MLRVLKQRLNRATSSPDLRMILECYHPAAILTTPYLCCNYLYTDSLDSVDVQAGSVGEQSSPALPKSGCLKGVYSHFRPVLPEENRRGRERHPRRRRSQQQQQEEAAADVKQAETRYAQDIYLDSGELFSQLCTVTNLVRLGPKPGMFLSHVNVSDGLIRVWRDWLAARAAEEGSGSEEDALLWADPAHTVGLRFRVTEKDIRSEHPVLVASDEELPVAYRLEFEELLLRTSTLLVMVDKSEMQEPPPEGNAIVIASIG